LPTLYGDSLELFYSTYFVVEWMRFWKFKAKDKVVGYTRSNHEKKFFFLIGLFERKDGRNKLTAKKSKNIFL